ncbi:MAG: trypsin-like peptidase domain-containing protein, partial [Planctomycetota bacterium]
MVARNSPWVCVLFGGACVAAGFALATRWPAQPRNGVAARPVPDPRTRSAVPSFADAVERTAPAVVTVRAICGTLDDLAATGLTAALADGPARERKGSGLLVPPNGLALTCRHLVADAEAIAVHVPGHRAFAATVVGEDRGADLALLRLEDPPADLPTLPMAMADDLRAGDWIVAVGSPLGLAQTVTAGVVSFVGRHLPHSDFAATSDFLQISAPVNPGNSGCPVVDVDGRVV